MFAVEMGWSTDCCVSSEGTPLVISQRPQMRGIHNVGMTSTLCVRAVTWRLLLNGLCFSRLAVQQTQTTLSKRQHGSSRGPGVSPPADVHWWWCFFFSKWKQPHQAASHHCCSKDHVGRFERFTPLTANSVQLTLESPILWMDLLLFTCFVSDFLFTLIDINSQSFGLSAVYLLFSASNVFAVFSWKVNSWTFSPLWCYFFAWDWRLHRYYLWRWCCFSGIK